MKNKRIFIAIPISSRLQEEIFKWEKKYEKLPVRWLAGKNIHITLIPPWYEDNVEAIIKKIESVKGESFDIEFSKVSYGSDQKRPRLIWAEGKASERIIRLKDELEKIFSERKSDYKDWLMHITIARFNPDVFSSFPVKSLNEKVVWRDRVNSFVLMESHLSSSGADYEVLKEFKF
ncbi:MAG: RNA 2',3'-cyclic phosphodiesterase [Patescibacteria group bacterium]|nr:RNA 2',3'-cyclic phosphodiesterase [Patescibacteria group bacterium]